MPSKDVLLVAAMKSCTAATSLAVCACVRTQSTAHQHTFELVVSFGLINLPRVMVCGHDYFFFIAKAALTAVISKSAW
jgi:hypothetical protein